MSAVVIAGNTSGSITLNAPDVAGTTTLNLPTVSGGTLVTSNSSGNVGIGTDSPNGKLDVAGSLGNFYVDSNGARLHFTRNSANYIRADGASGELAFETNSTERMRIDSSGNVLVGTASNISGGAHKQIISTTSDYQLALQATDTTNGIATLTFATGNTVESQIYYYKTQDRLFVVNTSAGVYLANAGTSWTSNSDERKKDIIEPIENAAEKVSTLRAVIGKYKTDDEGTRRAFLIAQDVQAVLPEAVDAANPDDLGVQYSDVIPLLVAAIKEQQAIITDLKARIEVLEGAV
jgi:hypothetical protein